MPVSYCYRLFASVFILLLSFSVRAQVDPVVVTATRTAQSVDATLAAVSVIDRQQIESLQPESVADLLRTVPGMIVSQTGGAGQPTAVFLRGAETDQVLVLIDGVKVGSATLGSTAFQFIDPDQIERIEVVRGPRSSLYGSDAIGGVIQIFTRDPGSAEQASAFLTAGSEEYLKAGARVSVGDKDRTRFTLSVTSEETDGYNVCKGNVNAGCFAIEDDPDGFESLSVQAGLKSALGDTADLSVSFLSSDGQNEFDGSFQNETKFFTSVLGATVDWATTEHVALKLSAGQSRDEQDMYKDGASVDRYDTSRTSLSLQSDISIFASNLLTLGVDFLDDEIDSLNAYAESSRENVGVFGQILASVGKFDMQAALRFDDNEQFGDATTGDASLGHGMESAGRWTLQYGTGFKAPTFNELYYPGFGNPDLTPEESSTVEVGYRWSNASSRWAVSLFSSEVDDLIAYDSATFAPANLDSAGIMGLEIEGQKSLGNWQMAAALTFLSAEQDGGAYDGNELPRRPGEVMEFRADRNFGKFSVGGSLRGAGSAYDDLANSRKIDSYAVVDLRANYSVAKNWALTGKIANLADEDYEHASYYRQPGRSFFLGLQWRRN